MSRNHYKKNFDEKSSVSNSDRCIVFFACVTACINELEVHWVVNRIRVLSAQEGKPGV